MDPSGMDKISIDGSCEMIMQEEEIAENLLMDCSKESLRRKTRLMPTEALEGCQW